LAKHDNIPKWRTDFPTRWIDDNYVTRRDFTKFLVLTSGAIALGNGYFVIRRSEGPAPAAASPMRIAAVDELAVGEVKLFHYPTDNDPAILVRIGETEYAAYRQRCTHLSCPVVYKHDGHSLECPCHNGSFDVADGRVLAGPPPSRLPKIALKIDGEEIHAVGWEEEA